eukprot:COSAG04_NODE_737_length_10702_cov_11.388664_4_plen_270_part_00
MSTDHSTANGAYAPGGALAGPARAWTKDGIMACPTSRLAPVPGARWDGWDGDRAQIVAASTEAGRSYVDVRMLTGNRGGQILSVPADRVQPIHFEFTPGMMVTFNMDCWLEAAIVVQWHTEEPSVLDLADSELAAAASVGGQPWLHRRDKMSREDWQEIRVASSEVRSRMPPGDVDGQPMAGYVGPVRQSASVLGQHSATAAGASDFQGGLHAGRIRMLPFSHRVFAFRCCLCFRHSYLTHPRPRGMRINALKATVLATLNCVTLVCKK